MGHPNEVIIERLYKAFAAGDTDALVADWTPDVVWHGAGRHPLAGDHRGQQQVLALFGQIFERTGGTFKATLNHALADDEAGYALHTATAERDGHSYEMLDVLRLRFEDGRVAEVWSFSHDQAAEDELLA